MTKERCAATSGLNRTFYGIETKIPAVKACVGKVLIVPFMELKLFWQFDYDGKLRSLNRTFYGIETEEDF